MTQENLKKINLKNDGILSFAVNQEKRNGNILKKLLLSNNMSEETRRSFKPVWILSIGYKIVHLTLSLTTTGGMLMISLFCSHYQNI